MCILYSTSRISFDHITFIRSFLKYSSEGSVMKEKKEAPKKDESSVEMPIDPLGASKEPVDPLKKEKIGRRGDVVR